MANTAGKIRKRMGIGSKELTEIFSNLGTIKEFIPENPQERIDHLLDMIFMMAVDGHIDAREVEVCMHAAERFGFDTSVIHTIVESMEQGKERDQISELLQSFV